jgi:cytochrome c-L
VPAKYKVCPPSSPLRRTVSLSKEALMQVKFPFSPSRLGTCMAIAAIILGATLVPTLAKIEFRSALDDSPLDMTPLPDEEITDAVKTFQETGTNPYDGQVEAIAAGKELYNTDCQVCHGKDGGGGMGLNLVDDKVAYPRVATDVGMFEVIHSGASGAMRSFKARGMTQDNMLKIIAYVRSLKK